MAIGWLSLIAAVTPPPLAAPAKPLTDAQMKAALPKTALHSAYEVQTNKLGQVTGARAVAQSKNKGFDVETFGNALQAFIRTQDGKAEPGIYRLDYDYDPSTQKIKRGVALVKLGGVDPNAKGAAIVMMEHAHAEAAAAAARAAKAKHAAKPEPRHS